MVRLILFDIDGTLIASGGAGLRAFAAVARHTFGQPNGTDGLGFAGRTDASIVREFFRGHGIAASPENFARFFDDYVFWLDHYLDRQAGRVLPGVWEFLRALRGRGETPVVGLLTGNIRLGAEIKLRHYGLWDQFVLGAFSDDHEDRNVLARIALDRGREWTDRRLAGEEVLVIGDTPLDIACAQAIGAPCLAVATGGTSETELRAGGARWVVPSLAEVDPAVVCS